MSEVALVTGSTRGIGKAAALELARRGGAVAVTGRTRNEGEGRLNSGTQVVSVPGSLESTVQKIEVLGGAVFGIEMDKLDRTSIDAAVDAVLTNWGRINGLFNNALAQTPSLMAPIDQLNASQVEEAMTGLMINHLHITQRVLAPMLRQGAGRIVFIISGAGNTLCELKLEQGGWGFAYAAGKAAFSKLADFVNLEYRDRGIACFHIQPGLTITEALTAQYGDAALSFGGGVPSYTPADTGRTVAWILDFADAITFAGPKLYTAPTFFEGHGLAAPCEVRGSIFSDAVHRLKRKL